MVDAVMSSHNLAGSKEIIFRYQNLANGTTVQADRIHLYNAINNLIDNAVKYSGEQVTINICFSPKNGYSILSVEDDGIGIAAGDLPHVFDKFYRVPSGNIHKVKGYGLGLNYVKHIMERHGGWCVAESRPGQGSTFTIAWQS
jgi:signal transduction histidine kinase